MADRSISELVAASSVGPLDLFVLEQNNTAKKLTGQMLENWLVALADGHGGIQSIAKTSTSGLQDTYTITLSDLTTLTFTVTNGKGVNSVTTYYAVSADGSTAPETWYTTRQSMTATNRYLWSYQVIAMNDGTSVETVKNVIGVWGDKGNTGDTGRGIASLAQTSRVPGSYTLYTFTMSDGTTETFYSYDGVGISSITKTSTVGLVDTYTISYTNNTTSTFTVTNARSIVSVTKTGTSGLEDTYTVSFNDGTTSTFTVANGVGISGIAKTSTSGLVDTYTVSLTDGTSATFSVTNAKSIVSVTQIAGTHAAGTSDTYRILFNDGDTVDFNVYNGANGTGSVSSVDGIQSTNQNVGLLTIGNGAPTSSIVGSYKSRYFDASNGILYICVGVDTSGSEATYSWVGAGGVVIDSALSTTSTNPVQNAIITSAIYTIINKIGGGSLLVSDTLIGAINSVYLSKASRGVIASGYSSSSTYAVGDCVMRSNAPNAYSMYRCIVPIETPESWTAAHWQLVTVADELAKKYEKQSGGIPDSDIASATTWNAKGTYSKPASGIPESDLSADVAAKINATSDWNENDSSNLAYIANRTHYAYTVYDTPVYEDTVMSVGDISSPDLTYNGVKYKRVEAGAGEPTLLGNGKYKITLGDAEWVGYKTVVSDEQVLTYRLYAEEIGVIYQEAYPDVIIQQVFLAENTDGGSIDVYQGTENVVKIDNKYLNLSAYRTAAAQDLIDATKQAKIAASGMLKGDGNGGVTAATPGTDYQAPLIAGTDYETPAGAKALGLTGASVGDVVRVNAVDANGKPTSWKHVPLNKIKCNKNLLDNWYFIGGGSQLGYGVFPINQRGQTSYSNTGYTFDRWKLTSGSMSITANGITLNGTLEQILEANIGQTVTASALLADGTMITPVYNDTTMTFTLSATGQTIKAVKLELGSEQTLAHQENGVWVLNEIPNYQTELTKCMAYFQRIGVFNDWKYYNCVVRATGSRGIICLMAIPIVPMRKTPTVTTSSTELQVVNYPGGPGSGIGTITGVFEVGYSRGDGLINIQFRCSNSMSAGKVAYAFIGSNGSGSIDLSAE